MKNYNIMAKFPSFQNIIQNTRNTIFRFPLETLAALIGVFAAIFLIEKSHDGDFEELYVKIILSHPCV